MGGYWSAEKPIGSASVSKSPDPPAHTTGGDVVVIPIDRSKQAEAAFLWYFKHVHKEGNVVRIIHCQEFPQAVPMIESWGQRMDKDEQDSRKLLELYQQRLADSKILGSVHFSQGHPGDAVIKAAEKFNADQIVMGTRGFGVIRRTILGSVSEYVIHHTKVPVTVVPTETTAKFF